MEAPEEPISQEPKPTPAQIDDVLPEEKPIQEEHVTNGHPYRPYPIYMRKQVDANAYSRMNEVALDPITKKPCVKPTPKFPKKGSKKAPKKTTTKAPKKSKKKAPKEPSTTCRPRN